MDVDNGSVVKEEVANQDGTANLDFRFNPITYYGNNYYLQEENLYDFYNRVSLKKGTGDVGDNEVLVEDGSEQVEQIVFYLDNFYSFLVNVDNQVRIIDVIENTNRDDFDHPNVFLIGISIINRIDFNLYPKIKVLRMEIDSDVPIEDYIRAYKDVYNVYDNCIFPNGIKEDYRIDFIYPALVS